MNEFISYINTNFKNHSNLKITIRVLECLDYIEKNIDKISAEAGKKNILRHPKNHLAFHLDGYATREIAKDQLLKLIHEVRYSIHELMLLPSSIKNSIINGFLLNINESEIGCMNARVKPALMYLGLFFSNGCQSLNNIMQVFTEDIEGNYTIANLLSYFSEKVEHHIPVKNVNGDIVPLSWEIIKSYLKETIAWDDIEIEWREFEKNLPTPIIEVTSGPRRTTWYIHYFDNAKSAREYLTYVQSVLPDSFRVELANASIKNTHDNHQQYIFKLTADQYEAFHSWRKAKPADRNPVSKRKFLVKSIRADKYNYMRDFIYTVTRTSLQQKKFPLRKGTKKTYTVTGAGVFKRESKTPQYTPEQKKNFSQPQSASLVLSENPPPLFGFQRKGSKILLGVMIDCKDVLLNRMFIYDGGTVSRPYDHYNEESAKEYYDHKTSGANPILHHNQENFEKAISATVNKDKHNEVLARMRWNKDGSSQIIIGSDNFSTRYFAQEYARLLRIRLIEQANENNEVWDDKYQIPICFYLPGKDKHLQPYDQLEQEKDREEASKIFKTSKKNDWYANNDYSFLLGLNVKEIEEFIINDEGYQLLIMMKNGYVHIAQSLLEKAGPSTRLAFSKILIRPYSLNHDNLLNRIFKSHENLINLLSAIMRSKDPYLIGLIEEFFRTTDYFKFSSDSILHLASEIGLLSIVKQAVAEFRLPTYYSSINSRRFLPIHLAAKNGHDSIVRELLKRSDLFDINAKSGLTDRPYSALELAAHNGHTNVVIELLKHPNIKLDGALEQAAQFKMTDAFREIIKHQQISILDVMGILKLGLLYSDINDAFVNKINLAINFRNSYGETALHIAIVKHNNNLVKLLLQHPEIDVNLSKYERETPFNYAFATGINNFEAAICILEHPNCKLDLSYSADRIALGKLHERHPEIANKYLKDRYLSEYCDKRSKKGNYYQHWYSKFGADKETKLAGAQYLMSLQSLEYLDRNMHRDAFLDGELRFVYRLLTKNLPETPILELDYGKENK